MECYSLQLDLIVDDDIPLWVNEVYPCKKGIAKSFQKCVEVP
jgi:hypothetical protein